MAKKWSFECTADIKVCRVLLNTGWEYKYSIFVDELYTLLMLLLKYGLKVLIGLDQAAVGNILCEGSGNFPMSLINNEIREGENQECQLFMQSYHKETEMTASASIC